MKKIFFALLFLLFATASAQVELGIDQIFRPEQRAWLLNKRVGLITNQTGINSQLGSTVDLFMQQASDYTLVAIFSPEHGVSGSAYAGEAVAGKKEGKIPVYSLFGETRRPTDAMLKGIDLLVYDIQDIGVRPYTYLTTLCYVMEEAAKRNIMVIVLDRPNPQGGVVIDGPMLDNERRSFVGYLNIPYCHAMTIGELALYFNEQSAVGCKLRVVPMKGWKRSMTYQETGLPWVPTSPNIPEPDTPFYCATTGLMGEIELVNIGIGYTLPFKLVGAPWIEAEKFAAQLNDHKLPGVSFIPYYFRPFYGLYKGSDCQGVKIVITDPSQYRPLATQYLLLGVLKILYPEQVASRLKSTKASKRELFCKVIGNDQFFEWLLNEKYVIWKFTEYQKKERELFIQTRKKYLLYE